MMQPLCWDFYLGKMGILSLAIVLIITAFTGWLLYNIYLVIGWEWSVLVLFLIACVVSIMVVGKEMDGK